jgi:predicted kinase
MYAPSELRFERVVSRKRNPSDATLKVAMRQEEINVGEIKWNKINSAGDKNETLNNAKKILGIA